MINSIHRRFVWVVPALAWLLLASGCDAFLSADQRVARADERIAAKDYRAAMIELKNALQDQPNHMGARLKLAEVELTLGDAPAADKDLRRAIELGAPPEATAELMGRTQLALGNAKELVVQIDSGEVVLSEPTRALFRGQALLQLQQYEQAQASFGQVAEGDEHWLPARVGIAEALTGQGKSDEAIALLDAVLKEAPEAPQAFLVRGVIRAKRGEFELAEQDLQQARQSGQGSFSSTQYLNLLAAIAEVQVSRGLPDAATQTHAELAKLAPDAVVTRTIAARIALAKQDYTAAISELQRALAAAPNFVPNRFLLGAAFLAQGNLRQAEQQLSQALQRAPENMEARKLLAQTRLRLGRPDAAMQVLLPVQDSGDDAEFAALLGLAHLQQGEDARGVAYLERAVAAQPQNANLKLDLAVAYLRSGQADKALQLMSGIDRSKADVRQMGLLIASLATAKDMQHARVEIDRLLAARPPDAQVLNLAAAFFARQGEFDRARATSQRAIDAAPNDVASLLARARIENAAGEAAAAQTWLDKAIAVDPKSGPAHMALADLALRRNDLDAATKVLEDLRKSDPAAVEARLQLARLYLRQSKADAAGPVVEELAALGKDRPEILNALGLLYLDAGRYDEALSRFQAATAQDNATPEYWLNTARAQISLGNSATAREALERALTAQPGWIPAVGVLAMLDVKEGRGQSALDRVTRVKADRPQDPAVLALEGDVHMALRDYPKASGAYDAAIAAKPSSVLAMKAYKARQAGRLPNTLQPLESWLAAHPADNTVRLVLAEGWQQAGDKRRAVAEYEIIDRNGGTNAIVLNNLAWLYYELKDGRAEAVAKRAYDAAPSVPAIADTYGWILVHAGKATQAVDVLKRAAAEAKDPSIDYHYAVALIESGAAQEGRQRLNDLLNRSSNFPEAAEARKLLESPPGG
ncbi:putative PEP-CTERM system TPR-repeat lipoprotein [Povalibacter uvarum]|uniref:Putative PEP-CTERM system TPR-repeat lipoprotein n=1 Tax=Povalibacter uvarum TaxID=732238 RepID=A0A841HFT0_9GAMM|nr:XrtA/PEP-CTERM system TPR-repeat protein PrsT [Povalibacter uvarum]MBB6091626.1 putative PEP-CTERM system TPR-repeat lipoprotein [Povalibacter uvarum]